MFIFQNIPSAITPRISFVWIGSTFEFSGKSSTNPAGLDHQPQGISNPTDSNKQDGADLWESEKCHSSLIEVTKKGTRIGSKLFPTAFSIPYWLIPWWQVEKIVSALQKEARSANLAPDFIDLIKKPPSLPDPSNPKARELSGIWRGNKWLTQWAGLCFAPRGWEERWRRSPACPADWPRRPGKGEREIQKLDFCQAQPPPHPTKIPFLPLHQQPHSSF